ESPAVHRVDQRLPQPPGSAAQAAKEVTVDGLARVSGQHPDGDGTQRIEVPAGDELPALGEVHHAPRRNPGQPLHRLPEDPGVAGAEMASEAALQLEANQAHRAPSLARSTARATSPKPAPSGDRVTKRGRCGSSDSTERTFATPTLRAKAAKSGASFTLSPT